MSDTPTATPTFTATATWTPTSTATPTATPTDTATPTWTPSWNPSGVDLQIVKVASAAIIEPGETLTYTLTITNAGPADASNLTVTDTLPSALHYVSANGGGWSCNTIGAALTCQRASLSVGAASDITLVTTVDLLASGSVINTASVNIPTSDPTPGNNSDTAITTINVPTAVELIDFHVETNAIGAVTLRWSTAAELDLFGFRLYRSRVNDPATAELLAWLPASPGGSADVDYAYTDQPDTGAWWYWLVDVSTSGKEAWHGPLTATLDHNGVFIYRLTLPLMLRR